MLQTWSDVHCYLCDSFWHSQQGNVEIGKLPLSQVLLCDDARFKGWLILVPRKNDLKVCCRRQANIFAAWSTVFDIDLKQCIELSIQIRCESETCTPAPTLLPPWAAKEGMTVQEVIDLSEKGQELLWKEVAAALRVIQRAFEVNKLNVSAVGNIVGFHL